VNVADSSKQRDVLIWAIVVVVALTCLILISSDAVRAILFGCVLCVLAYYSVVLLHEVGHTITGLQAGYRFVMLAAGPVYIFRGDDSKLHLKRRVHQRSGLLGFAMFLIEDFTDFRRRMLWFVIGGPLSTAIVLVVSAVLYAFGLRFPNFTVYYTQPLIWALGIFNVALIASSFSLLLGSLYPSNWVSTDGNKLRRLLYSEATAERMKAQIQTSQANVQGIRPRDWSEEWIASLIALDEASADTVKAYLQAYRWALDRGDEAVAERYLTTAVRFRNHAEPKQRVVALNEAAFFEMRYHANIQNAEEWVDRMMMETESLSDNSVFRMRMLCAVGLTQRKYDKVRQMARQAIEKMDHIGAGDGISIMERDLFKDMITLCDLADEMQAKRA
jgi:hypothetical protein